jgi:hypothetical protein
MSNQAPVPTWLSGVWERLYIRRNGGPPDRSFNVRNVQTPTLFGDVRIPKDRPSYRKPLHKLSDAELQTLYTQQGFSGFTTIDGYVTTWHHEIDYQPPDGTVDISRLQPGAGRNMMEIGIPPTFEEHWWYLESGEDNFLGVKVLRQFPNGTQRVHQIFSVVGDHFIYARNRPKDLPMADSLADLIQSTHATRDQILEYLDCEISGGFVLGGRQPWEIQFSTFPDREGEVLAFASDIKVDPKTGKLSPKNPQPGEVWSFPVNTLVIDDLVVLFPPDKKK